MSSGPQCELLTLPPELIEIITRQITDNKDLAILRLTCKTLEKVAAKELFKSIYLSPSEDVIDTWHSISEHDIIRHIPRHVLIHTQPDIDAFDWGEDRERTEIDEEFENAIAALSRFSNLDSVEIGFTPECKGDEHDDWDDDVSEDPTQRAEMLKLIFQWIDCKNREADKQNRTIRKLTITNLQNYPVPEFTPSELFRDVMAQLEELHISLVHEVNQHGPDHDYTKIELQTFPPHLCTEWLLPISENLKALSLYHRDENWGPFPGYFDFSALQFPKLETLALGYYTLAHDNDIDWILRLSSLRTLILHNCMIASCIRITNENLITWVSPTHNWTTLPSQNSCTEFFYPGRWSTVFARLATLPKLTDFHFARDDMHSDLSPYHISRRLECGREVFAERYVVFDNGILPTHWPEADEDGTLHTEYRGEGGVESNLHVKFLEEDRASLRKLVQETKRRKGGLRGRSL